MRGRGQGFLAAHAPHFCAPPKLTLARLYFIKPPMPMSAPPNANRIMQTSAYQCAHALSILLSFFRFLIEHYAAELADECFALLINGSSSARPVCYLIFISACALHLSLSFVIRISFEARHARYLFAGITIKWALPLEHSFAVIMAMRFH